VTTYSVASPVVGALQVHVDGCAHLPRLFARGGGVLSDGHPSALDALTWARFDDARAKLAPCAKAAAK